MSEETAGKIPVEPVLVGVAQVNGSENSSPLADSYLSEKLEGAEQLLGHAAKTGVEVDTTTRDAILKARTVSPGKWSEETTAGVFSALTNLAAKLKPVTVESLGICAERKHLNKIVKSYRNVAIGLAIIIIPFSLAAFITSGISKAINADIEKANVLAVKLGDEIRSQQELVSGRTEKRSQIVPRDVQEFAAIVRAIDGRARQLNLYIAYSVVDPFYRTWRDIWANNREKVRKKFEVTPGQADSPTAATGQIATYQDVRYFAQSIMETVSTIYGGMATCILPVLYALLGACAYLLRSFEEQFKLRTFNPDEKHIARFVIAAIGGAVVGLFNNFNISQTATIPPLAIAFLVGYAADVFFSFLENLLQTFAPHGNTASATKPTKRDQP
jgi:hypothetical protein